MLYGDSDDDNKSIRRKELCQSVCTPRKGRVACTSLAASKDIRKLAEALDVLSFEICRIGGSLNV